MSSLIQRKPIFNKENIEIARTDSKQSSGLLYVYVKENPVIAIEKLIEYEKFHTEFFRILSEMDKLSTEKQLPPDQTKVIATMKWLGIQCKK